MVINMNLKESILCTMPSNLSSLEKARYIYLKLCLILKFDTRLEKEIWQNENGKTMLVKKGKEADLLPYYLSNVAAK